MASIWQSSDTKDSILITTGSVGASSDLAEEIARLVIEKCGPCQKKTTNQVLEASWYCQQCDDILCQECKSLHNIFKPTENHSLLSLHPPCGPCQEKKKTVNADSFCVDCQEFLCDECLSYHRVLKITKNHNITKSREQIKSRSFLATEGKEAAQGPSAGSHDRVDTGLNADRKEVLKCHDTKLLKPFSERTAKFISKFDSKQPEDEATPSITDICVLSDSRVLLLDQKNKALKMFDANFHFVSRKKFQRQPCGLAVYDNSEVAVTEHDISRLSTACEMEERGKFKVPFVPYGIAYVNRDRLAITGKENRCGNLYLYTTTGTQLTRIPIEQQNILLNAISSSFDYIPFHVTFDERSSRAYVSTTYRDYVSAVDLISNKTVFKYKHKKLERPSGLTVDEENNVYVCGAYSQNIHQLSPDGKCTKILLSKNEGLIRPLSISFMPDGNTFLIGQEDYPFSIVQLFKME